jgi:hypothetical protein
MTEKGSHKAKLKARLEELNAELDRLEAEMQESGEETPPAQRDQIRILKEKTLALNEALGNIQESDEDSWQDLKQGAENIWTTFRKNFSKAKSEFKRGYKEGMED